MLAIKSENYQLWSRQLVTIREISFSGLLAFFLLCAVDIILNFFAKKNYLPEGACGAFDTKQEKIVT